MRAVVVDATVGLILGSLPQLKSGLKVCGNIDNP